MRRNLHGSSASSKTKAWVPDVVFCEPEPCCACCEKPFTGKWTARVFMVTEKRPMLTLAWKYAVCLPCMDIYRSGPAGRAHVEAAAEAYHDKRIVEDRYIQCGA